MKKLTDGVKTSRYYCIRAAKKEMEPRCNNDDDEMPAAMMNDCISRPSFLDDDQYIRGPLRTWW
jgi:hypothetical protein